MRRLPPLPFLLVALTLLVTAASPQPPIVKGLAQLDWSVAGITDRATLGVATWYAWGDGGCAGPCINMNRNWTLPQVNCYPVFLLGNEPTNPEPAGHPISSTLAASVTVSIEQACPAMRLIVANIHLNNIFTVDGECCDGVNEAFTWLADYLEAYKAKAGHEFNQTLGIHCYSQYAAECLERLARVQSLKYGGQFWLTEFAVWGDYPYTSGAELALFLKRIGIMSRLERVYIWTNRGSPPIDLVNDDGTLSVYGQVYHDWVPPVPHELRLPELFKRQPGGGNGYP